jgi:hypothetical protein
VVAGYVGVWVVSGEWSRQEKRENGKNDLKSSSSLPLHMQGKKKNNVIQNDTVLVFLLFLRKGNEFEKKLKKDYDNWQHDFLLCFSLIIFFLFIFSTTNSKYNSLNLHQIKF